MRGILRQLVNPSAHVANAGAYWPADGIRRLAEARYGGTTSEVLRERLGIDDDLDEHWDAVERNLREGHVRLLFVADHLPAELRRVIEFLNRTMDGVDVLGVEVAPYSDGEKHAFVPRVIGQTELARIAKQSRTRSRRTSEEEFLGKCAAPTVMPVATPLALGYDCASFFNPIVTAARDTPSDRARSALEANRPLARSARHRRHLSGPVSRVDDGPSIGMSIHRLTTNLMVRDRFSSGSSSLRGAKGRASGAEIGESSEGERQRGIGAVGSSSGSHSPPGECGSQPPIRLEFRTRRDGRCWTRLWTSQGGGRIVNGQVARL